MPENKRKNIAKRIARIHGHVHGIMEMLEQGRPYSEIVHQIYAVRAGLDSAVEVIVEDLVDDLVLKTQRNKGTTATALELKQVIARIK